MFKQLTVLASLLLLAACGKSPADARKELVQLNIPYDEYSCQQYAAQGDEIAINLFLATDIDPGCLVSGAVQANNIDLAKQALKQEFNPNNQFSISALQQAVATDQDEMAKFLIGKAIKSPEALATAAKKDNLDLIKLFLDKGANPDHGIVEAVQNGHLETTKFLLAKGANPNYDPNIKNSQNSQALCVAAQSGQKEIVKLLLDSKANPNSKSNQSCLVYALANNHFDIAQMLRKAGAVDSFLTGKWRIQYDVDNVVDSAGNIQDSYNYQTHYVNLTHNNSIVTGNLAEGGDGCSDAKISGKVVDNQINLTLEFTGDCCPAAKSSYQGKVNYNLNPFYSTNIQISGNLKPLTTPPPDCELWVATFEANPVTQ